MPPSQLFDLDAYDLTKVVVTREQIYKVLPHRGAFMLLDGALVVDPDAERMVAFANVPVDAWWSPWHFPGRPLLPGVCMIEMAAQAAWYYSYAILGHKGVMAFASLDECKFRGTVEPPCRLLLLGVKVDVRRRRHICAFQGIVDGKIVFSAKLAGVPID